MNAPINEINPEGSNDPSVVARELIATLKMDTIIRAMTRQVMAQKVVSIQQKSKDADPEELKEVTTQFQYAFNDLVPELLEEITSAYSKIFDVDDMKAVIAFHQSDLGKRFEAGQQSLQVKTKELMEKWTAHATQSAFETALEKASNK